MPKEVLRPPNLSFLPKPEYPYSPGTRGGRMVYTSGQVAWNENSHLVGIGDPGAQTAQVLKNIQSVRADQKFASSILRDTHRGAPVTLLTIDILFPVTPFLFNLLVVPTLVVKLKSCLLYTSPSPRDGLLSRMPSSA